MVTTSLLELAQGVEGNSGAYVLHLRLPRAICVHIGRLGEQRLRAGHYLYVGSALRGLQQRVDRHTRLGREKVGKLHWHIDYLLVHPEVKLTRRELYPGAQECRLSQAFAGDPHYAAPLPGFGATDCTMGCPSHLYRRLPVREQA